MLTNLRLNSWQIFAIVGCVLLFPALLINLGLLTHIDDEAIRALVALEMGYSGNWITPTLLGEYYYNKPPLFNWIVAFYFDLFNSNSEFVSRLPTIVSIFGFGLTIFLFLGSRLGYRSGFVHAFVTITCGRILFWDSMLGLIDITFSWVIFSLFISIYILHERKQILLLFLVTYFLTAIGFLMKGLPALVFQAVSLLVFFVAQKEWKRLFSIQHILGILLLFSIIGYYYFLYNQVNSLENVFSTLFTESSKRTAIRFGILETIKHIALFPFEMVYHFLPWSLLIVYLFDYQSISLLRSNKLLKFLGPLFIGNILVYWTSPEVYPRYLLMLAPLFFGVLLGLHPMHETRNTWQFKLLYRLLGVVMVIISLGSLTPLFLDTDYVLQGVFIKTLFCFIILSGLTFLYWRNKSWAFEYLILFLLIFRIGFNWFVLPDRNANDFGDLCRQSSLEIGKKYKEEPLFIYGNTIVQRTNAFYLTSGRENIIIHKTLPIVDSTSYFIFDPNLYPPESFIVKDTMYLRHGKLKFYVGQIIPE